MIHRIVYDTSRPSSLCTSVSVYTSSGFTYGYTNTTVDALYRRNQVYQYISKRESMDEFIHEVSELPLLFHPGIKEEKRTYVITTIVITILSDLLSLSVGRHWYYSIGFDVAGVLMERVSKQVKRPQALHLPGVMCACSSQTYIHTSLHRYQASS